MMEILEKAYAKVNISLDVLGLLPEGEVAAFQSQFEMAKKKAVDIEKDKAIKRYAELQERG